MPQLYAWHKVYVDEAGAVVAPPEDEEAEELEGGEGERISMNQDMHDPLKTQINPAEPRTL